MLFCEIISSMGWYVYWTQDLGKLNDTFSSTNGNRKMCMVKKVKLSLCFTN
jgi:hypothetical protein